MSVLDQVRAKFKVPREGTFKPSKSPSAGSAGASPVRIESDQWAIEALRLGALHRCRACRHFMDAIPPRADDLGAQGAGWCHQYNVAAHPLVPFVCDGYSPKARDI